MLFMFCCFQPDYFIRILGRINFHYNEEKCLINITSNVIDVNLHNKFHTEYIRSIFKR